MQSPAPSVPLKNPMIKKYNTLYAPLLYLNYMFKHQLGFYNIISLGIISVIVKYGTSQVRLGRLITWNRTSRAKTRLSLSLC